MTKRKAFIVQRPFRDGLWAIYSNALGMWYKKGWKNETIYFKTRAAAQKKANQLNRGWKGFY
jgi:hypothetical protein